MRDVPPDYTLRAQELMDRVNDSTPVPDPDDDPSAQDVVRAFIVRMMHIAALMQPLADSKDPRDLLVLVCLSHTISHEALMVTEICSLALPPHIIYEANNQAFEFLNLNPIYPEHN